MRVYTGFTEGGADAIPSGRRQTRYRQALSLSQQAHLIAIGCSPVPDRHDHQTLRILAGKAVELGFVATIQPETIRALLKNRAKALAALAVVYPDGEW